MLSAGVAFAEDNATDDVIAIDDEVSIDETLAVDADEDIVSESATVTSENFKEYFDDAGSLRDNVTADELVFEGNFKDVSIDVSRAITLTGKDAVLDQGVISISGANVTVSGFTINQNNWSCAIFVFDAPDATVSDNVINFNDSGAPDTFAVGVYDSNNFKLINNEINYIGATNGTFVNNGLIVKNSNTSEIKGNKFKISLVSVPVYWDEYWVGHPKSEGIVVESSNNVVFIENDVDVTYSSVSGSYDTIYAIDFKNSNNALIGGNVIKAVGYNYIYGILINGNNFIITSNNITSEGDYYANGIDVEGPATGILNANNIDVKAKSSAYGIYSGMNGADVKALYLNNNITGKAYNIFGMSLGDVESFIESADIQLEGNYTTGIAYRGSNISVSKAHIVLMSSEVGNESIWEDFGVEAVGIKVIKGDATVENSIISTAGKGISLAGNETRADLSNNFINVVATFDKDAYGVYAVGAAKLTMNNNTVDYQGTTNGTGINNGVYIENIKDALILENTFFLELISAPVNWVEEPAGSWNYVGYPISEGIVVKDSDDVAFDGNKVETTLGGAIGSYDTIYAIAFKNSNNAIISNNDIEAAGHTYIYAVQVSGDNFRIAANNITSTSDNYYANGIDVEGPATGEIEDNGILAKGVNLSYPIYSGMNGKDVKVNYTANDLAGEAYFVLGMSLGDVESNLEGNTIDIKGNYTTGIAFNGAKLNVSANAIYANASNVGNESIEEIFGVETVGAKVVAGVATIKNNNVKTTGQYSVKVGNTTSTVTDNFLAANELFGDASVNYTGDAVVKDNRGIATELVYSQSKTVLLTAIKKGSYFNIVLKDEKGNVLAGKNVTVKFNGKTSVAVTDKNGAIKYKLTATKTGTKTLTMEFAGEDVYDAVVGEATIKITKEKSKLTANKKTFKAKTKTKKYTVVLKDSKKKAIKKVKVTLKVKGKTYKAKTNSKGKATFKITKLTKKGKYTAKVKFAGNTYYKAAQKSVKITVKK